MVVNFLSSRPSVLHGVLSRKDHLVAPLKFNMESQKSALGKETLWGKDHVASSCSQPASSKTSCAELCHFYTQQIVSLKRARSTIYRIYSFSLEKGESCHHRTTLTPHASPKRSKRDTTPQLGVEERAMTRKNCPQSMIPRMVCPSNLLTLFFATVSRV